MTAFQLQKQRINNIARTNRFRPKKIFTFVSAATLLNITLVSRLKVRLNTQLLSQHSGLFWPMEISGHANNESASAPNTAAPRNNQ